MERIVKRNKLSTWDKIKRWLVGALILLMLASLLLVDIGFLFL